MKKVITKLMLLTSIIATCTACGKTEETSNVKDCSYRECEVAEADPVITITKYLGEDVSLGEDYKITSAVNMFRMDGEKGEKYQVIKVSNIDPTYLIFFTYDHDSKVAEAKYSDVTFVHGVKIDADDEDFGKEDAISYKHGNEAVLILRNGKSCSNIFGLDTNSKELSKIYFEG